VGAAAAAEVVTAVRAQAPQEIQTMADTYAIVESGGKQYKVEKGETLLLDRLPAAEGEKVDLRAVMFRDSDVITDAGELEKVKVEATISEHLRGPKIKVFKYKAKKGYKRTQGHRSELTRVEITDLKKLTRKPAAKKAEPKAEAKAETKPKAEAKPAAKKTTTRKSPAKKPARKPATKKGASDGS
jgi:large subunit ribosomal protein L21